MELTHHGFRRILGRTKMVAGDVLALIQREAFVSLGDRGDYEYLLFYSPFDGECKIAIVNKNRTHLVSVWEKDYRLPEGILRVSTSLERAAQRALRIFVFKKAVIPAKPALPPDHARAHIRVHLTRNSKRELVYIHECGIVHFPQGIRSDAIFKAMRSHFLTIASTVEAHKNEFVGVVHYQVKLFAKNSPTPTSSSSLFSHRRVIKSLRTVSQ